MKIGMEIELSGDKEKDIKLIREFGIHLTFNTDKITNFEVDDSTDIIGYDFETLGSVFRIE